MTTSTTTPLTTQAFFDLASRLFGERGITAQSLDRASDPRVMRAAHEVLTQLRQADPGKVETYFPQTHTGRKAMVCPGDRARRIRNARSLEEV